MNHFLPFLVSTPAENLKLHRTFVQWMEEHANFRDICEEGKGENKNKNKEDKTVSNLMTSEFRVKY